MGVDEVQAAYDDALHRVLADLSRTTTIRTPVSVDFTEQGFPYSFGTRHQSWLPRVEDAELATVELADRLQEDVLEELWGRPWPMCPGHPHPCAPALVDEVAVWRCPDDDMVVERIGGLNPTT